MKTRYKKVLRDLRYERSKYSMLVLAIMIGVIAIGIVLGTHSIITRAMTGNYSESKPASATIDMKDSITVSLLESVRQFKGIAVAERHGTVIGRMKVNDRWHPLLLFVIDDFNTKRTNKVRHISGAVIPGTGTMLVERTAYSVMNTSENGQLIIKTPNGAEKQIGLSGTVQDAGLAPAWQEQAGYGYIGLSTLQWLGEAQHFHELRILVSEQANSLEHVTATTTALVDWLTAHGHAVEGIQIPPPGKHPHQSQMNTVMTIMIIFAYMILLLAAILVSTTMSTLMVKHVRQIGIMKTIGATPAQVAGMYAWMLLVICIVALVMAVPLGRMGAIGFSYQIANMMNLELGHPSVGANALLLQIASGILIPLVAIAIPVIRGSSMPVKKAMNNYGVAVNAGSSQHWVVRLSSKLFNSETILLSIRNVFRQRRRLVTTICLLAAGGAVFMTALNVSEAWDKNLEKLYVQKLYDLDLRLQEPMRDDRIIDRIEKIPGIRRVEGWYNTATSIKSNEKYDIARTYPDKGHGSFSLQALPLPTLLLHPALLQGKWLDDKTAHDVVLNQLAMGFLKEVHIGDSITLQVNGFGTRWRVIGFISDFGTPATAYVSIDALSRTTVSIPQPGIPNNTVARLYTAIKIGYTDRSRNNAWRMNQEIEKLFAEQQIGINMSIPVWLLRNAVAGHMKVIINSLLTLAILMGIVGLLGLASVIGISVLERTREIGVMRAIGASPVTIRKLITREGIVIGIISVVVAFVLSLIVSYYFGRYIGAVSFKTPLLLTVSGRGLIIWLLIIFGGSFLATLLPARSANKITTREALAYE